MIFNWQTLRRSRDPAHFELSCKSAGGVVAAAAADADAVGVALFFGAVVNPSMPRVKPLARCVSPELCRGSNPWHAEGDSSRGADDGGGPGGGGGIVVRAAGIADDADAAELGFVVGVIAIVTVSSALPLTTHSL